MTLLSRCFIFTLHSQTTSPREAGDELAGAGGDVSTQPVATSVERALTRMAESPEVMNIRQASQYLGISPDTLYKYVYEEKIPAFKLGNRWKFKKTILDSWMEEKSTMGEGKAKKRPKAARAVAR